MVRQKDGAGFIGPFDEDHTLGLADLRVKLGGGPFKIRVNGKIVTILAKQRARTLKGLAYRMDRGRVGDVIAVLEKSGAVAIMVREAKPSVEIINTNGNDKADECWTAVIHQFEFPIYFLGAYVCKYVAGSSTRSQHSYGNAVDFGSDSMTFLHIIADWVVDHATELNVEHVIVADQVWTRGYGWSHYSGEYHYHTHVDFHPELGGGCGVRNG